MINLIKKSIITFNKEVTKINQETKKEVLQHKELTILNRMIIEN